MSEPIPRVELHGDYDGCEFEVELPSGQILTMSVSTSIIDGSALVHLDTRGDEGNVRIFVNDGKVFDADPETGEYRDMRPGEEG